MPRGLPVEGPTPSLLTSHIRGIFNLAEWEGEGVLGVLIE